MNADNMYSDDEYEYYVDFVGTVLVRSDHALTADEARDLAWQFLRPGDDITFEDVYDAEDGREIA